MDHAIYDKRKYPIVDVQQGYSEWSQTYEQVVEDEMDIRLINQLRSVDWAAHTRILDLACGTGRIGTWLQDHTNAIVDGLDITPEMMDIAKDKNVYQSLFHADATNTKLPDATYDICIQSLADEHISDLYPLYAEVARVTKPGGYFVLIGFHPYFLMTGMPTHYDRASGESITIRTFVHLLSDHIKAAYAAGWTLLEMEERLIDDAWLQKKPKWKEQFGLPISFAFVWRC